MLELKKISKVYHTAGLTQKALDDVSIIFRKNEFVSAFFVRTIPALDKHAPLRQYVLRRDYL